MMTQNIEHYLGKREDKEIYKEAYKRISINKSK